MMLIEFCTNKHIQYEHCKHYTQSYCSSSRSTNITSSHIFLMFFFSGLSKWCPWSRQKKDAWSLAYRQWIAAKKLPGKNQILDIKQTRICLTEGSWTNIKDHLWRRRTKSWKFNILSSSSAFVRWTVLPQWWRQPYVAGPPGRRRASGLTLQG